MPAVVVSPVASDAVIVPLTASLIVTEDTTVGTLTVSTEFVRTAPSVPCQGIFRSVDTLRAAEFGYLH